MAKQDTSNFANFKIKGVIRAPKDYPDWAFDEAFQRFLQDNDFILDGDVEQAEDGE